MSLNPKESSLSQIKNRLLEVGGSKGKFNVEKEVVEIKNVSEDNLEEMKRLTIDEPYAKVDILKNNDGTYDFHIDLDFDE